MTYESGSFTVTNYAFEEVNTSGTNSSIHIGETYGSVESTVCYITGGDTNGRFTLTGRIDGDTLYLHAVITNNASSSVVNIKTIEKDFVIKREGYTPIGFHIVTHGYNTSTKEHYYSYTNRVTDMSKSVTYSAYNLGSANRGYICAIWDHDHKFVLNYDGKKEIQYFDNGAVSSVLTVPTIIKKDTLFGSWYSDESLQTPLILSSRSDNKMFDDKVAYCKLSTKTQIPYNHNLPDLKNGLVDGQYGYRITDNDGWIKFDSLLTSSTSGNETLKDYTIYLDADLDFTNTVFTSIGYYYYDYSYHNHAGRRVFSGIFDGRHHKLINPTLVKKYSTNGRQCYGLSIFSTVVGGIIKNLHVVNISVSSNNRWIGGIAAHIDEGTHIHDCTVSGSMNMIADSYNDNYTYTCGIVANANISCFVYNCLVYSDIGVQRYYEFTDDGVGLGEDATFINCAFLGTINFRNNGGNGRTAIGLVHDGTAINCYFNGFIMNSNHSSNYYTPFSSGSKPSKGVYANDNWKVNCTRGTDGSTGSTSFMSVQDMKSKDFVDQLNTQYDEYHLIDIEPWIFSKFGFNPYQNRIHVTPTFTWGGGELSIPDKSMDRRYVANSNNTSKKFIKPIKSNVQKYTSSSSLVEEKWSKPPKTGTNQI